MRTLGNRIYQWGLGCMALIGMLGATPNVQAQSIQEHLIVTDNKEGLMNKAFRATFDTSGNYYFETLLKGKGDRFSLLSNSKTFNPVYWDGKVALSKYKAMITDGFFSDSTKKSVYIKNKLGTKVYGPYAGRVRDVLEYGKENMLVDLCIGATSYLYINDSMVNRTDSTKQKYLCAFSNNNHVLYMVYQRNMYRLYHNHKLIDSSNLPFKDLSINDNNHLLYVKQIGANYYIYHNAKTFGPFKSADFGDLWDNDAYYYRGCADTQCYVLVNDKVYTMPEPYTISEDIQGNQLYNSDAQIFVYPHDKNRSAFTYNKLNDENTYLNINGKETKLNYHSVSQISLDQQNNFACWGLRLDQLKIERTYKNINGTESKLRIWKKKEGYKPQPLGLDAQGNSTYFYVTRDSIFLYRNDTPLLKPVLKANFLVWDASLMPISEPTGLEQFQGVNADKVGYIVYNGTLSKPFPAINPQYDRYDTATVGSMVTGVINNNGFFVVVCTAPGKYTIDINNTTYTELTGMDRCFPDQSYLTPHEAIFYGQKGNSFYEYRVKY